MAEEAFTAVQLQQLEEIVHKAVGEALGEVGLRVDNADHQDEAREDLRFLRRLRKMWDGAAGKVGNAVLGGLVTVLLAIIGAGFWTWLSQHLPK